MTVYPARAATRPDDDLRFLVLPVTTGAPTVSVMLNAVGVVTVRRVRVVPDPASRHAARSPAYEGFALFDRSHALERLFVIEPSTRHVLEWQLGPGRCQSPPDVAEPAPTPVWAMGATP
jgi:hypothetical protein